MTYNLPASVAPGGGVLSADMNAVLASLGTSVVAAETSFSNSTAELALLARTIPANMAQVGTTWRVTANFSIDNVATSGTLTLRLRWGGVGAVSLAFWTIPSVAGAGTNQAAALNALVTVRSVGSTGSAAAGGHLRSEFGSLSQATAGFATAPTIDTTTSNDLTLTAQWATASASNTCRIETGVIEVVRV